jgi:hypothetical protein
MVSSSENERAKMSTPVPTSPLTIRVKKQGKVTQEFLETAQVQVELTTINSC